MLRRMLTLALLGGAALLLFSALPTAGPALAEQGAKPAARKKSGSAVEGQKLFMKYCASCHGQDAKGHGPVAPSLKKQPADLTHIALEDGKFPSYRVEQTIAGEQMTDVHGTREMPVWGSILRRKGGEGLMKLEIYNLTRYLETIQQK
ncbi:MAG: c-type cytochrome [Acidobacteria bacterium]|nr:c-type cytochrome [Acidobacteriota bacterium]